MREVGGGMGMTVIDATGCVLFVSFFQDVYMYFMCWVEVKRERNRGGFQNRFSPAGKRKERKEKDVLIQRSLCNRCGRQASERASASVNQTVFPVRSMHFDREPA